MQPQPGEPTAPNGVPPQTPPLEPVTTPPADNPPAAPQFSLESFSEDDRKYLAGQGITSQEQLTSDNLAKVFNHARTSQQTAQQRQAELDRIRAAANPNPAPTPPANPFAAPAQPSTTPNEPTPTPPAQPTNTGQGTDEVTMFLLAGQLAQAHPELKTELSDGTFYQKMAESGFTVATADGRPNMQSIQQFATHRKQQLQFEAYQATLNKPGEGVLPDANPGAPAAPRADAPMTKQIAQAIIAQNATADPRYAEAQQFLSSPQQ